MLPLAHSTVPEVAQLTVLCLCYASQSEACRRPIATSKMLLAVGDEDVLDTPALCYAYVTAVDNVACGEAGFERSELLRDEPGVLLGRLRAVVARRDEALVQATAKALYSLSCSHANVAAMTRHDVLSLVREAWEQRHPPAEGPRGGAAAAGRGAAHPTDRYLLAVMYNLSSHVDTQGRLVSDGFMELLVDMFDVAKLEKGLCVLACYTSYHMACGATSSARLVESGCASILCFFSSAAGLAMYKENREEFSFDVMMRCAMSIRNLICVVANQGALVAAGCVDALVELAEEANESLGIQSPSKTTRKGISFKEVRRTPSLATLEMLTKKQEMEKQCALAVRKNTAAALRCLTFNKELRGCLEPAGAVGVLLQDLKLEMSEHERDFEIDYNLLEELESESWENGSRVRQTEGRAVTVPPAPLRLDFLQGNGAVVLDVHVREEPLEKFTVRVEDDEEKKKTVTAGAHRGRSGPGGKADPKRQSGGGAPVDDEVLPDTIASLARFAHDDSGAYTSMPVLDRRPCTVLPLADALNPPTPASLVLSDLPGEAASGPLSVAGTLVGNSGKASSMPLGSLRSPADVASPIQQQQSRQQPHVDYGSAADVDAVAVATAIGGAAFSPGKTMHVDESGGAGVDYAMSELKMASPGKTLRMPASRERETHRDTQRSTPNSGSQYGTPASRPTPSSPARYDLPPLATHSSSRTSSNNSMLPSSGGTPKKKLHVNRLRATEFDTLAKMINSTHETNKWDVDVVLESYSEIQRIK